MKKVLLFGFFILCALCGYSESKPADDILAFVRSKLPNDPLTLTGTLKVRTQNGFTQANLPVEMKLDWGAEIPMASYQIDKESLEITWKNNTPNYTFSNSQNTPTSDILGTGINWADLSFSVLWWPKSRLVDEGKKINRDCYIVDVPVPNSLNTMRLWIEKKMGMLLEVQTLDGKGKQLRHMKIKSIKKMDGMWIAKDLEIKDSETGSKTTLQISSLEWIHSPREIPAFDPAASVNEFTFDLYHQLAGNEVGNFFLSPYSISSALAMVYGGARGETATQMGQTLRFGGQGATHPAFGVLQKRLNGIQDKGQVQLYIANSLWPQETHAFLPDYLAMIKEFYDGEVEPVDFKSDNEGARKKINVWVEDKTKQHIKNLIPNGMLSPGSRLVLANAIYFKGTWTKQFNPDRTHPAPFTLTDGSSIEVSMMSQTSRFKFARAQEFQALELPYEGDDLSMLILLPNQIDGLTALEKMLSTEALATLNFREREVMVSLPRFKLESSFQLSSPLSSMGMPQAFSEQADFSGMDGSQELFIGAAVHKAFVEVNEEGTEAAAATAVGMRLTSMPTPFNADHPFLFLIRENSTDTILFIGRVTDPSA